MTEAKQMLYDPKFEHDACGIGAVVNIDGHKDYRTLDDALTIVEKLWALSSAVSATTASACSSSRQMS